MVVSCQPMFGHVVWMRHSVCVSLCVLYLMSSDTSTWVKLDKTICHVIPLQRLNWIAMSCDTSAEVKQDSNVM